MKFDDLFEQRSLVGSKLKECIKERGYTKVSFAKLTDISRPTLDKLLNGEIDNKSTFNKHINKILPALNISAEELVFHDSTPKTDEIPHPFDTQDYHMCDKGQKQYNMLMDIVGLCEIYY